MRTLCKLVLPLAVLAFLANAALAQLPPDPNEPKPVPTESATDPAADQRAGTPQDPAAPTAAPPAEPPPAQPDAPAKTGAEAGTADAGGPALPAWIQEINARPWDTGGNFWFPTPAAKEADASDRMFYVVLALSIFFFVGITIVTTVFVIKYRARPGHKPQPSKSHNDVMEITWTVIPTLIVIPLFIGGWNGYIEMSTRPAEPLQIKVTAKKWNWDFEYPNGLHLSDLHVPVDRPVELQMTSVDVLHSFWVPAFRNKQDIVPRRYTYVYFTATRPGTYRLYCTEYCGKDHSQMKVKAHVHDMATWERYLAETKAALQSMDPKDLGKVVFETKGCAACHSVDGSAKVGPSWKGVWGEQAKMADGSTVTIDAAYVKTAIEQPQKQSRPGYPPSMPTYAGQLSEAEITGVAAYIESLK
jgi:cytochrome c oxidase subunit 2